MDCPRCGTPNMSIAKFCRRCGEGLQSGEVAVVLGAMSAGRRTVRADHLRAGRIVPADSWYERLSHGMVYLGEVPEAFLAAAKAQTPAASMRLVDGGWEEYRLLVAADPVTVQLRVRHPYLRIELRGPRQALREIVRHVAIRHGEDLFTARDGRLDRFLERTGLDEAQNKATLLDLLS